MTSIDKQAVSRRHVLAWLGGALGASLLGPGGAWAAQYYTLPRIEVRGDRGRLGWSFAYVTIAVNAPDSRAVQALERVSRDIDGRVKRLLSSKPGSEMLDQYRQRALKEEIEKIVLGAAPRGTIQQITQISMLVYP